VSPWLQAGKDAIAADFPGQEVETRQGLAEFTNRHRHAFSTLAPRFTLCSMTGQAISAKLIACHVIDTHFEPLLLELNGIL
jgi:hypothetical protein